MKTNPTVHNTTQPVNLFPTSTNPHKEPTNMQPTATPTNTPDLPISATLSDPRPADVAKWTPNHRTRKLQIQGPSGAWADVASGYTTPESDPDPRFTLRCVLDDAATYLNAPNFDDFCNELGLFPINSSDEYNNAQRIFNACREISETLASWSVDPFDALETLSAAGVE